MSDSREIPEESLVVEIVWHDDRWRGACRNPLANEACLTPNFYIWGEARGDAEEINALKPQACGDPTRRGRCSESTLFLDWRWERWPGAAPALSRQLAYILFVFRSPENQQQGGPFTFSGFYQVERIEKLSEDTTRRWVYANRDASSWFSPQVEISLEDYAEPSRRMALKGIYIPTVQARQILNDALDAHRKLLLGSDTDSNQKGELVGIIRKLENALGARQGLVSGPGDIEWLHQLLKLKGQIVLTGPPGVGKTYQAQRLVSGVLGLDPDNAQARKGRQLAHILRQHPDLRNDPTRLASRVLANPPPHGVWDIVQFHPSYTYEDFVRGIQAEAEEDRGVVFHPVNRLMGLLTKLAEYLGPDTPVLLIVDEINRGDLSKVLGELIYALEYRGQKVMTPYAVDGQPSLRIPPNFYLIGTMNTADRAIALVDYAIRRRFSFVHLVPDRQVIEKHYPDAALREQALDLFAQIQGLFDTVGTGYRAEDLMVGHSYFLAADGEELAAKMVFEVAPLLVEYFKEGILAREPTLEIGETMSLMDEDPIALEERILEWLEAS